MRIRFRLLIALLLLTVFCNTCTSQKRADAPKVPIAIIMNSVDPDVGGVNLDYYGYRVLDELDDFQRVNLEKVMIDENPEITLTITIENYTAWPKEEYFSRRVFTRPVVVGQDVDGRLIYRMARAVADIVEIRQRIDARFATKLQIKGSPGKNFQRIFTPNYRYSYVYVDNIQGDPRAVDPSIYATTAPPIEPDTYDLLLELSRQEMIRRLANEIRSYYR